MNELTALKSSQILSIFNTVRRRADPGAAYLYRFENKTVAVRRTTALLEEQGLTAVTASEGSALDGEVVRVGGVAVVTRSEGRRACYKVPPHMLSTVSPFAVRVATASVVPLR